MAVTFGNITFAESLDQIGADLKVGVSITDKDECFFIAGKDETGEYNKIFRSYCCDWGVAVGDMVGAIESVPGSRDASEVFIMVEQYYNEVKQQISSLNANEDILKIINTVMLLSNDLFNVDVMGVKAYKNLLALPLFVEVMSGCIRDGVNYNFKTSDKILSSFKRHQETVAAFLEDVMLYDKNTDPADALTKIDMSKIPLLSYSGYTTLIRPDCDSGLFEAFIPDTYDDLISYLLNRYAISFHFYCCSNCRRYFAFKNETLTKNCHRIIETASYAKDIGKTCLAVGRLRSHSRGLYSDETQKLYQRNYKAAFSRKKNGSVAEESFTVWGEQARQMRDKCLAGDISYEELERWFRDNYLKE